MTHGTAPLRALPLSAVLFVALAAAACGRRGADDPALQTLDRALLPGERLVLTRSLDPSADDRFVAVVRTAAGKPELRVYQRAGGRRDYVLAHKEQQGDEFHNLVLEDVDGDGQEEMVTTWTGGHLELLDVIARGADGTYRSLFQNAGQEIERRYGPGGVVEFWITSRTYQEQAGQTPTYDTQVYRWDGKKFSEVPKR